jgi:hypothetical protein
MPQASAPTWSASTFVGLKFPVSVSWYYLKRDGQLEKRFVLYQTSQSQHYYLVGKRRWQIEGWFKTAKHRFGLHRFGQGTLLGVYRWLVLSLITYIFSSLGVFVKGYHRFTAILNLRFDNKR